MKQLLMFAVLALIALTPSLYGDVPNTISYQGILATSTGDLVPDGNYDLQFKLYDAETGGSVLWQELHSNVPVVEGRFHVILGTITSLTSVPFDATYWLGIMVEPPSTELPRIQLTSSAYSLNARSVQDDAVTSAKIQNNAVTSAKIQNGTIQFDDIGQNGAATDQVMMWNGSAWGASDCLPSPVKEGFSFITYKSDPPSGVVAYGVIYLSGVVASGSNITSCTWNDTYKRYEIQITGEYYYVWDYVTVVTPLGSNALFATTGSVGGKLLVYLFGNP